MKNGFGNFLILLVLQFVLTLASFCLVSDIGLNVTYLQWVAIYLICIVCAAITDILHSKIYTND